MELKVNFAETDQTFNTSPVEENQSFDAEMEDAVVLPGGENGATFIPDVSDDGVISWTNDKGLSNPDPVDITGPVGPAGKDGADGAPGKDGVDGENGKNGERGTGILRVTTAPQGYVFAVGGKFPKKRMALSTICNEAGVSKVLVGDIIAYESEHCHVYYIDSTYAFMDTVVSVKGADGAPGKDGTDGADGKDGAQWYFTQVYDAVLQYGNDGDLSVDLASPDLPVYKVDKANNQMVYTGAKLKGEQGDAGQWYFLETFEMALQYDFVNDGDIVVDLADPRLGIFKVDKVNNQMIFTGAYLKGEKGDPYTLTETDKAKMVESVISALPKYTGEVESV